MRRVPFPLPLTENTMDSSIHAHLMSQYVKDRIELADAARLARAVEPGGVRLPRLPWRHSARGWLRRRPRPA
jgi:hypothetical protein